MTLKQIGLMILLFLLKSCVAKEFKCGFPGTPAYGFVKPDEASYEEGDVVMYTCHVGYILLGSPISRCKEDGSWSEDVPICDDSMTTLVTASSSATAPGYPAELAIDRNKDKCTYLQPKKHRWWRIDLGGNKEYKVLSVAITMNPRDNYVKFTVYVAQFKNLIASFNRCAYFSGKFGTPTVLLSCAEGKGIDGHAVHIEDHNQLEGLFEICEVEIQVEKDTPYDCGFPSRSLHSISRKVNSKLVEYDCLRGYEMMGDEYRRCLRTGQWSNEPPTCEPIVCDELEPFENGVTQVRHGNEGPALEGAIAIYNCNKAYKLSGSFTRNCTKDGSWSGKAPKCKAIICPVPDGSDAGGVYRLVNRTNSMGSVAMLRCKGGKIEGDNPYITCTEEGEWTESEAKCIIPVRSASEKRDSPRIVNQGAIIFGMVVAAVMIVVVLVGLYLYGQKRRNIKPEIPSRLAEPPSPPPRPPPRAKGNAFKTAFKGFLNRENIDSEKDGFKNSWKTRSLPLNQVEPDETSPKKTLSYEETLPGGKETVVEAEVLAQQHKDQKGVFASVPEESENATVDDVVLDMEGGENINDSSAKDSGNALDYAAVDYEKKRQSRVLKGQDSMESSTSAAASPLPDDDIEEKNTRSPTPPKRISESEEEEEEETEESEGSSVHKVTDTEDSQKESERQKEKERQEKEEEERKAKEEEELKKKEEEKRKEEEEKRKEMEAEKNKQSEAPVPGSRRRRARDDPPPPADEKPVLRRLRKF